MIEHYAIGLFVIGLYGAIYPRNLIGYLMAIEIILLSIVTFLVGHPLHSSQSLVLVILTTGGAELALGLALVMQLFFDQPDQILFLNGDES